MSQVPNPILDTRDGDRLVAEAIESLPDELSDRSDSNPAVAIIEAAGSVLDRNLFQVNQWPRAVLQKLLAVVGIELLPAAAGTTTLKLTLPAPDPQDVVFPAGTEATSPDGEKVYQSTEDLTIEGYGAQAGTIAMTAGSTTVTGTGTSFSGDWDGDTTFQIQGIGGAWYTIASVAGSTSLTLATPAVSSVSGVAFRVGPITGTVNAKSVTPGLAQGAGAGVLTQLQSSVVAASVTNINKSAGEADEETIAQVMERAPLAFCARDVAVSASDYEAFAQATLGRNARAKAILNRNLTVDEVGTVTIGLLSPTWQPSPGATVTATERAEVVKDLFSRSDKRIVDVPVPLTAVTPAVVVFRNPEFDSATTRIAIAEALNSFYSPNTYEFGRAVFSDDIGEVANGLPEVNRTYTLRGILCAGSGYTDTAGTLEFTNGDDEVVASNSADVDAMEAAFNAGRPPIIMDTTNNAIYIFKERIDPTTFKVDHDFEGPTVTATFGWFQSDDAPLAADGSEGYRLPYCALSTDPDDLPPSIMVIGVA